MRVQQAGLFENDRESIFLSRECRVGEAVRPAWSAAAEGSVCEDVQGDRRVLGDDDALLFQRGIVCDGVCEVCRCPKNWEMSVVCELDLVEWYQAESVF